MPVFCTVNMAVAISGRSRRVVDRWLRTGQLRGTVVGSTWQSVYLADLAEAMQRPITVAAYMAAVCLREKKRLRKPAPRSPRIRASATTHPPAGPISGEVSSPKASYSGTGTR